MENMTIKNFNLKYGQTILLSEHDHKIVVIKCMKLCVE